MSENVSLKMGVQFAATTNAKLTKGKGICE